MPVPCQSHIHRGHLLFATRLHNENAVLHSFEDGALEINQSGKIVSVGPWTDSLRSKSTQISSWGRMLIVPGFVDTHIHFPQVDIIGSHGEDLLGWLAKYTFPAEARYAERSFAEAAAQRFLSALLESGTTSAAMFSSSHYHATDALFHACAERGMRAVIGQVAMDQHAPEELLNKDLQKFENDFLKLHGTWHGYDDRLFNAVTPRFAPACSHDLLQLNSRLAAANPDVLIQTHFAESLNELKWVRALFPKSRDYLGVYEDYGLLTSKSVFAHGLHVSDDEQRRLSQANASISHCPSSNMFLGSGIMPWRRYESGQTELMTKQALSKVRFALGSDVGAGTWFSLWKTMGDAYKSQRLSGYSVNAVELLARATIDGANLLNLTKGPLGFAPGAQADFQIVDWTHSDLLTARENVGFGPEELLFSLMWNWESHMTKAVFIRGQPVFDRDSLN